MSKLLIINKSQFGYHTDSLKYCEYLKDDFDVTYICFDAKKEKVVIPGVNVKYISGEGSFLQKGLSFIKACKSEIKKNNYSTVFCVYFQGISTLVTKKNKSKLILDIRTGYVGSKSLKKWIYNTGIRFESQFFEHITIISESLSKLLKLKESTILPLGADIISETNKNFSLMKLIYVGTITNRNINETVEGFKQFQLVNNVQMSYDIFGSGIESDEKKLIEAIGDSKNICFHGYKHHSEIKKYFDECTIGVSYVPITSYFNVQPPTKTFEYILSGIFCIATKTYENRKIITPQNGVLCDDNSEGFFNALEVILTNKKNYDSELIRGSLIDHTWKNIVETKLKPLLNKID